MRAVVFALITLVIYKTIVSLSWLHSDEAWLMSASVGILIACRSRRRPKKEHLKVATIYLLLVLGMYFFAFKAPKFLSGFADYHLAVFVCAVVYASCYWFFVIRKFEAGIKPFRF